MSTTLLALAFLLLQCAFIWARYAIFRTDGPTPWVVRGIEASATASIVAGAWLIIERHVGTEPLFDVLALLMVATSAAIFAWAVRSIQPRQLSVAFSPDAPVELLRLGAYSFVRNPFYLAYMLGFAMPAVASRSWWGVLPAAWMAGIYWRAACAEERKFLGGPLAEEYRCYCAATGRFLPRLPWPAKPKGARHGH